MVVTGKCLCPVCLSVCIFVCFLLKNAGTPLFSHLHLLPHLFQTLGIFYRRLSYLNKAEHASLRHLSHAFSPARHLRFRRPNFICSTSVPLIQHQPVCPSSPRQFCSQAMSYSVTPTKSAASRHTAYSRSPAKPKSKPETSGASNMASDLNPPYRLTFGKHKEKTLFETPLDYVTWTWREIVARDK